MEFLSQKVLYNLLLAELFNTLAAATWLQRGAVNCVDQYGNQEIKRNPSVKFISLLPTSSSKNKRNNRQHKSSLQLLDLVGKE